MWFLLCIGCLALAAGALLAYTQRPSPHMRACAARIPGPKPLPVLGNALMFMAKPEETLNVFTRLLHEYGDYIGYWLGQDFHVFITNPADVKLILTSNKVNQKGPAYDVMKEYVGPGILSGGPTWRNHRKIVTPAYSKKIMQYYHVVFNEEARQLAEVLCNKNTEKKFNVYKDVVEMTTQCVCRTVMGLSKEESRNVYLMDEAVAETHDMYDHLYMKMTKWWLQIPFIYWLVGAKKKQEIYIRKIEDMAADIIEKRRRTLKKDHITALDDDNDTNIGTIDRLILSGELTYHEIIEETITLFTASQEATAKIASTVLLILAHLPDWQEKVYNEIIDVLGPDDTLVSIEDTKRLQYLDMVYKEALRYMPIGAIIQRTVEEEIAIKNGEIVLPIGTSVNISIYHVQRDPRFWEDPDEVKPERFLPENVKKRDPNAYIPFSLGPMDCLGRIFATVLIKILVVRLLRHVILEADGNMKDLQQHVAISVKFAKGYNLRARPRNNNTCK